MAEHLPPSTLIDVAEDRVVDGRSRAHLSGCESCQIQVHQVRADLLELTGADVPEPSPLYWEAFQRQVAERVQALPDQRVRDRWMWAPALVAAALTVAVIAPRSSKGPVPFPTASHVASTLPAWSALPAAGHDDGLVVLRAFASQGTMDHSSGCVVVEDCLADLGDDDVDAVTEALRAARAGGDL